MFRPPRSLPADVVISSRSAACPGARPPLHHVSNAASATPASAPTPALTPARALTRPAALPVPVAQPDGRIDDLLERIAFLESAFGRSGTSSANGDATRRPLSGRNPVLLVS